MLANLLIHAGDIVDAYNVSSRCFCERQEEFESLNLERREDEDEGAMLGRTLACAALGGTSTLTILGQCLDFHLTSRCTKPIISFLEDPVPHLHARASRGPPRLPQYLPHYASLHSLCDPRTLCSPRPPARSLPQQFSQRL